MKRVTCKGCLQKFKAPIYLANHIRLERCPGLAGPTRFEAVPACVNPSVIPHSNGSAAVHLNTIKKVRELITECGGVPQLRELVDVLA